MEQFLEVVQSFFVQPSWLIPAAVSIVLQMAVTHRIKVFLPNEWTSQYRDAVIWLLSAGVGILVFVPTRWAWLTLDNQPFSAADFVLSVMMALFVIGAMPWIYSKLPAGFRDKHSYRAQVQDDGKL